MPNEPSEDINKKRDDILYEIERFSKKNYLWFLGILIAVFLYFSFLVNDLSNKVEIMNTSIAEDFSTVVAVTDSGTMIEVEKQELFADMQENVIARALRNLIVDRAGITNGFKYTKFDNNEEIVARSEKLKYFLEFVLLEDEKRVKDVRVKNMLTGKQASVVTLRDQAIGFFDAYIEALKQMLRKDTLPHFTSIKKVSIKSFSPKGSSFKIEVNYNVVMQNFDGYNKDNSIKYQTSEGNYMIAATGYFDIRTRSRYKQGSNSNGTNKLGLHFTSLKITKPSRK